MRYRRSVPFFLFVFLLAGAAQAQRLTGVIRGTVSDETGSPLPGVSVTVSGPALISGAATAASDIQGHYRFPALPPGEYDLQFSLEGFQGVRLNNVRVTVGSTIDENASMSLSSVSKSLVVTGESTLVDLTRPGYSADYPRDDIRDTPTTRFSFFDFVQMAPGSSPMRFDNTLFAHSILGSGVNENLYQMDGTDLTSALTGAAWPWPNTDTIEEIEILELGAPAEYGNYQGAVVNVVTKSGWNQFHGDVNLYVQPQSLTGRNVEVNGFPYHNEKHVDGTFQLGGPLIKDRIWFFAGYQSLTQEFSEPGTDPKYPKREDDTRYFLKVTANINKENKIAVSFHDDYYKNPLELSITRPFETALTNAGHNPTPSVTWTSTLSEHAIVEVRYAGFYGKDRGEPQNGQYVSGHYDFYTGYYSGGILSWYDGDVSKSQVSGKISYYADNFLHGDHDFRFGVQYTQAGNDYIYAYTNGVKYYDYNGQPYSAYVQLPYHIGADVKSTGFFVDDTWSFNDSLTLNLGARFDHSTGAIPSFPRLDADGNATGDTVAATGTVARWNVISPRLGFAYKLPFRKATLIRGHFGRYYQAMLTPYIQRAGPARSTISGYYFDPDTGLYDDLFFQVDPTSQITIDPHLKDPCTDQFAVGFDHQISADFAISASYVYKRSRDFIGTLNVGGQYVEVPFVDPLTGRTIMVKNQINDPVTDNHFLITNPDFFYERYHGFLLAMTKRMSKNWRMNGSLTISRARGLNAGSGLGPADDQDSSFFPAANARFGEDPNDFINADGLLNGDRTYMLKLQGTYDLPWGIIIGGSYAYLTGRPYARQVEVTGLDQGPRKIFAERRDGSRRTSNVSLLDLRIGKTLPVARGFSLSAWADILNVLNSDAYTDVATTLGQPGTEDVFGVGSVFVPPRRVRLGAAFRF